MNTNFSYFSFKTMLAVFGILFLAGIIGAVVYKVNIGESFNLSFAQKPVDEETELRLLEEYFSKNNIPLPENYKGLTTASNEFKISVLKPEIIKRELIWKSGAVVVVGFTSGNEPNINFMLDSYRQKLVNSTRSLSGVFDIFNQIKTDQAFGSAFDSNLSGAFGPITKKARTFPSDKIYNAFWSSPRGTVSELYKLTDQNQYAFFVVADSSDRGYQTYEEWLKAVSPKY